jgi:hypothetical protein
VKDRVDSGQGFREGVEVAKVAGEVPDLGFDPLQDQTGEPGPVAIEGDYGGAVGEQRFREPAPDEPVGTGDQRLQATCSSLQTRQGGSPVSQRSFRSTASL